MTGRTNRVLTIETDRNTTTLTNGLWASIDKDNKKETQNHILTSKFVFEWL